MDERDSDGVSIGCFVPLFFFNWLGTLREAGLPGIINSRVTPLNSATAKTSLSRVSLLQPVHTGILKSLHGTVKCDRSTKLQTTSHSSLGSGRSSAEGGPAEAAPCSSCRMLRRVPFRAPCRRQSRSAISSIV